MREHCSELLGSWLNPDSKHAFITDEKVNELYGQAFARSLPLDVHCHACAVGESSKSFANYEAILNELLAAGLDRQSTVIAFGGGVPGDLAGFVAASYMRGINFVQIPTTLLAQVDSSVGGKTGINMPHAKNSVGAFWQPAVVVVDPEFLRTLDEKEFTSGLAEVVKYGVIMDETLFGFLEENARAITALDMATLESVIRRCCELKARVVEDDERETSGLRAILNYGHTFGHAIEAVFGYGTVPHGHAVAMGMHAAALLAKRLNRVDDEFVERQSSLLSRLQIPHAFPRQRHEELADAMKKDKKAVTGDVRFVLPTRIGHVDLVSSVDRALVLESMKLAGQPTE